MTPAREREIRDRLDALQASRLLGDHPARWAWELLREVDALREQRRADARLREALRDAVRELAPGEAGEGT